MTRVVVGVATVGTTSEENVDLTTETDRRRLERTLDVYPMDWQLRLALADVLEEAGEDVAACGQRWQWWHHAAPLSATPSGPWSWWKDVGWEPTPGAFRLPEEIFRLLAATPKMGGGYLEWCDYPTRAAAEADLARALSLQNR